MKGQLILENGERFTGTLFGDIKNIVGEVVFTTGMTGYQETLTDPSFAGQIVTMTFPLIGNYGINLEDMEAEHTNLKAFVVREKCDHPSNFRNEMNLDDFLKAQGVVGLEGVDTRALTRIIRDYGVMNGVIMQGEPTDDEVKLLMNSMDNSHVIMDTTTDQVYTLNKNGKPHVAFIDMGAKDGILRDLQKRGCKITVFPANIPPQLIEDVNPDMIFISNGPGDPLNAPGTVDTVKTLIGKYPICGICMGHQIIGLALGCSTKKLKFGHHGGNHPVKDLNTGNVYITSQNHNYIVSDYPESVEETFVNVNDGTCEGIRHKALPIQSVQFHPEASPGPLDTGWLFDRFLKEVK
ncbi:MAG: glutamine-hydrolyzing carbamoyl-phosphate synthase small subunit [Oscillospiraceae bacterium]|nr:glutamine-hydrolyzing carbamoyl-phosphate synthase small subunit [Oscillospiraceae bacterium]